MPAPKSRLSDASFDLNLAPFLDIIVAVVPMLLLSVVFVEVKMLETPVPQIVADANNQPNKDPQTTLTLAMSNQKGFVFDINDQGKKSQLTVAKLNGAWDLAGLTKTAQQIKTKYPKLFQVELAPAADIKLDDMVKAMDAIRKTTDGTQFGILDPKTGKMAQTNLMFPETSFANLTGE